MAQPHAPNPPRAKTPFTTRDGLLTPDALAVMQQLWRQVAAGFVTVPVVIGGTANELTLTPKLTAEGGRVYADHMAFAGVAATTSTGSVTAKVTSDQYGDLASLKVYKTNGAAQAGSGDLVAGSFYTFWYVAALDDGAGGLVLK